MKVRHFALAFTVVASAACADNATTAVAPTGLHLSANSSSNGTAQSINGNADIDVPAPQGLRRLVIHARKETDGTVSGQFKIRQEWNGGQDLEADIMCFTIVGNKAYVGGVLKAVDGVPYNGHLALRLVMVDNGEGSKDAPDQSSQAAAAIETFQPQAFCNNASLVLPMHNLVRGNLQVRP